MGRYDDVEALFTEAFEDCGDGRNGYYVDEDNPEGFEVREIEEDEDEDHEDPAWGDDDDFADPTGRSALRAASAKNPRIYPCPNCGEANKLTRRDVDHGYQCNDCADRAERGGDY